MLGDIHRMNCARYAECDGVREIGGRRGHPHGCALDCPDFVMQHDISYCDYIMRRDIFRREILFRGRGGVGVVNEQRDVEIPNVPKDLPGDYASCCNKTYHIIALYSNNMVYYLLKGALS